MVTIPNTLPVSLIEFNASLKNNGALITWSTASELNNNHFILEKSIDGVSFNAVATINGKGTTHEKSNYQFTDVNFFQSAYYRLTQVDLNGTKTVYDEFIKHLKSLTDADKITVYPNPTVDLINIKLPTSLASTLVKLVDINGKILDSKIGNGKQELTFAVQHLPKGVYLLQYTEDSRLVSQKVVKL
ncbi:MAG: T9SS type A sorting domain-containing protein [Chitinophagaceae bacterium]|nr:MAG: T9SS type A sorting domain-containing protein [Chitinophagaceae bacterium]